MADLHTSLAEIRRPPLLIRAARFGLDAYHRDRDLKRLLRRETLGSPARNFDNLLNAEAGLETERREGSAAYSVTRHIETLVALIAEARLIRCDE